jgi:hypothetical protein
MDTLSLIDSNRELKETTDRLFFDQYRYSLKLQMKDFSCLREIRSSTKTLDEVGFIIAKRFNTRLRYNYDTYRGHGAVAPSLYNPLSDASNKMRLGNLIEFLDFLWPIRNQIKLMFSGDWGYIYSNDKDLLTQIEKLHYVQGYYIKEAVVSKPKNTVVLKSSPYRFRSYFSCKRYDLDQKARILSYLENQSGIKISRGLKHWLKYDTRWPWSRRYHYFDHNDAKIELMLQLIFPDLLRTTMPIIEVNN